MKKVLLIPDSFKGTLSSAEICTIMETAIRDHFPDCRALSVPVADGGEGSVDCFLTALGGERVTVKVKGPFFEDIEAAYGLLADGKTAVVEVASCAGLPLAEGRKNPETATTYGVGQQLLDAAARGAERIIVGLGGSATNDGGCGAAAAAGVIFRDARGEAFIPTGGTLKDIVSIDVSGLDSRLSDVEMVAMCDIDNPMAGPEGAAAVFAPQKGADTAMVERLDEGLRHLAAVIRRDLSREVLDMSGAGAAGGMGAGMSAFFGAVLRPGIETVLDTVGFQALAADADWIFTGEGKLDAQSLHGKVVAGVGSRAKSLGVPVIAVVGGADPDIGEVYSRGISAVFSINRLPEAFETARYKSRENLFLTMDNILRLIKISDMEKR